MPSFRELRDEDRARAAQEIDNFFAFTRDVLDDPSILEQIPTGATVEAVPKDEAEAGQPYDIETAHMVATVTPRRRLEVVRRGVSNTVQELGSAIANRKPPAKSQRSSRAAKAVFRHKSGAGTWAMRRSNKTGDVLAPAGQNKGTSKQATKPTQKPKDSS